MSASGWYHLDNCRMVFEGPKSFKVITGDGRQLFIPFSQLHPDQMPDGDEPLEVGDKDRTVTITAWLAEQEGLI